MNEGRFVVGASHQVGERAQMQEPEDASIIFS